MKITQNHEKQYHEFGIILCKTFIHSQYNNYDRYKETLHVHDYNEHSHFLWGRSNSGFYNWCRLFHDGNIHNFYIFHGSNMGSMELNPVEKIQIMPLKHIESFPYLYSVMVIKVYIYSTVNPFPMAHVIFLHLSNCKSFIRACHNLPCRKIICHR